MKFSFLNHQLSRKRPRCPVRFEVGVSIHRAPHPLSQGERGRVTRLHGERGRSGYSLLELVVAMILLATVMTIVVPTLSWMSVQNRLALQRQEALQEMHNLMDGLTTRSYQDLTPAAATKIELSPELKRQLPGSKLQIQIEETPGEKTEPIRKRIHMELSWNQRNGQPLAPLRLTAWVHQQEGDR